MKSTLHSTFLSILLVFLLANFAACQSSKLDAKIYVFDQVHVLPMNSNTLLKHQTVIIKNGKIKAIGKAGTLKRPKRAVQIEAEGKYLMPGLAEMHAHIPVPENGNQDLLRETLFLYLANGVTTIRGMLGDPFHLKLKKMIKKGGILSPRVYTSSPSLNGNTVPTKAEARQKVMSYKKAGYDFLKIHPGIKLDVFKELVATAKAQKIPFAGHVPADVGIEYALASGYASIDHLDGYVDGLVPDQGLIDRNEGGFFGYNFTNLTDLGRIETLTRKTKETDTWVVPTQTLFTRWFSPKDPVAMANEPEMKYMASSTLFRWRQSKQRMISAENYNQKDYEHYITIRKKLLANLHNEGVNLLLGSDAPQVFNVPGFSIIHEMKTMADAGLSNYAILESGTVNPARFFEEEGKYGLIAKGASADLILLEQNPLEDVAHVKNALGVMVRGQWLSREAIDKRLDEIAKNNATKAEEKE